MGMEKSIFTRTTLNSEVTGEEMIALKRYISIRDIRNRRNQLIAPSGFVSLLVKNYIRDEVMPLLKKQDKLNEVLNDE